MRLCVEQKGIFLEVADSQLLRIGFDIYLTPASFWGTASVMTMGGFKTRVSGSGLVLAGTDRSPPRRLGPHLESFWRNSMSISSKFWLDFHVMHRSSESIDLT